MKDNHVGLIGCGGCAEARALSISSEIQMVFRCGPRRTLFGHAASLKRIRPERFFGFRFAGLEFSLGPC